MYVTNENMKTTLEPGMVMTIMGTLELVKTKSIVMSGASGRKALKAESFSLQLVEPLARSHLRKLFASKVVDHGIAIFRDRGNMIIFTTNGTLVRLR